MKYLVQFDSINIMNNNKLLTGKLNSCLSLQNNWTSEG